MKKLALSLLFGAILMKKSSVYAAKTTDLGALQIVTPAGVHTYATGNTLNMRGTINVGVSGDTISMQGADITAGTNTGNTDIATVLSIDSTNQIVGGPLIQLGSASNNRIVANTSGNLTITSDNSGDIVLNSAGYIAVSGTNITNPAATYGDVVLALDSSGAFATTNDLGISVMGKVGALAADTEAYIQLDNRADNPGVLDGGGEGITLNIADVATTMTNAKIYLNAGTARSIKAASQDLTAPIADPVALCLTSGGLVKSSNKADLFVFGDNENSTSFISVDNTGSTGIILNSSSSSSDISLNAGSNDITLTSGSITDPESGQGKVVLALDSDGDVHTTNALDVSVVGKVGALAANTESYIKVDNTETTGVGIALNIADATSAASLITIDASNYDIKLLSQKVANPDSGQGDVALTLTSDGYLKTSNALDISVIGKKGALAVDTESFIRIDNTATTGTGITISVADAASAASDITIDAGSSYDINLSSSKITDAASGDNTALALDENGNLLTSNQANKKYSLGDSSDSASFNAVVVDNATFGNGVKIMGDSVYFDGQGLEAAAEQTNTLTIDENGKLGILVSAEVFKENIRPISFIDENAIDKLKPVEYNYKGKKHREIGFIADEFEKIPDLKSTVIHSRNGKEVRSLDYRAVFVAVIDNYLKTKKKLEKCINDLTVELSEKDSQIRKLENKLQVLEATLQAVLSHMNQ